MVRSLMLTDNFKLLLNEIDIRLFILDDSNEIIFQSSDIQKYNEKHFVEKKINIDNKIYTVKTLCNVNKLNKFDHLTGLFNQKALIEELRQNKNRTLIMFDINNFKQVNNSCGLITGNNLLKEIASRLIFNLATPYRYSGDVFALTLPTRKLSHVENIVKELIEVLSKPFHIDEHEFKLTISVGVALYDADIDAEILIRNADTALGVSKSSKNIPYFIYDGTMTEIIKKKVQIQNDLRKAIDNKLLYLVYQPQENLITNELSGFEALVRWEKHNPIDFIQIAEETGYIIDIGYIVIDIAIHQASIWKKQIAINLSPKQLKDKNLISFIKNTLIKYSCDASYIAFEITETSLMDETSFAIGQLNKIHRLGIEIFLDDFGTGFSSLSYLKNLPVSKIKIDKSFIDNLLVDTEDQAIVKTIISLAKNLQLKIIAEGVETKEQRDILKEMHCDEIQGYLFGRPSLPDTFYI